MQLRLGHHDKQRRPRFISETLNSKSETPNVDCHKNRNKKTVQLIDKAGILYY